MKAAKQNSPDAQNALGIIYKNGLGVIKNEKKALMWATKAYSQGYEEAYDLIKSITGD